MCRRSAWRKPRHLMQFVGKRIGYSNRRNCSALPQWNPLSVKYAGPKKGISQKKLGEIIGVSESTISQYEAGKREPDFDKCSMLANYFQVSFDTLFDRVPLTKEQEEKLAAGSIFEIVGRGGDATYVEIPAAPKSDGLREKKRMLLEIINGMDETQIGMYLEIARAIRAEHKK